MFKSITPSDLAEWREGSPVDWANESHDIAVRMIYGELKHTPGPLPANYEAKAPLIIDEQLERAGVRLAA